MSFWDTAPRAIPDRGRDGSIAVEPDGVDADVEGLGIGVCRAYAAAMTQPKLHYFPIAGRAGAIRDAFRIGRIPFEDHHVGRDEFRRLKTSGELPYGSLPALDLACEPPIRIAQSNAILRYVGKLAGLYPTDPVQALRVDELIDFAEDVNHALSPSMQESDMEKKLAMRKVIAEEKIPHWCRCVEARLATNGDGKHLVGDSLTIADLKLLHLFDSLVSGHLDGIPKTVLEPYAALETWRAAVRAERDAKIAA